MPDTQPQHICAQAVKILTEHFCMQSAEARQLSETDRDVMEKGTKAFVSYIRGYKEHQCKFIFRVPDLDVAALGSMFGLLRLPAMQEVCSIRRYGSPCLAAYPCISR
jgi:hypothetical protein